MAVQVRTFPYIIISILLFVIIVMMSIPKKVCDHEPCAEFDTSGFYNSMRIDYPNISYVPSFRTVYKVDIRPELVVQQQPIDSLAIVKAFFNENIVIDTVMRDSNIYLVITDTISQNKIKRRTLSNFSIYPKYKIVTVTEKPKEVNKVYAGFGVGGNQYHFGMTANLLFVSKRSVAYGVSYDFLNNDVYLSLYWKLSFRKSFGK